MAANAWCEVEGIGERIAVRVVGGEPRTQLLKARRIDAAQAARTLLLACQRPLPNGAAMRLEWGRGIAAAANANIATRVEQRVRYTVRPAFTAEFSCERERANAPCLPIRPMRLGFSAPVPREVAAKVRLTPTSPASGTSGSALAPVCDKDDTATDISALTFPTPLSENAAFTLSLPADLKDNAGRVLANAASFPLKLATGAAPPIAKFAAAPFGVIEATDAVLPVTLRQVQGDLRSAARRRAARCA